MANLTKLATSRPNDAINLTNVVMFERSNAMGSADEEVFSVFSHHSAKLKPHIDLRPLYTQAVHLMTFEKAYFALTRLYEKTNDIFYTKCFFQILKLLTKTFNSQQLLYILKDLGITSVDVLMEYLYDILQTVRSDSCKGIASANENKKALFTVIKTLLMDKEATLQSWIKVVKVFLRLYRCGKKPFKKLQKQSFTDVLKNRCSEKFGKFHRKTSVLESLFNEVAGPPATSLKRDSNTGAFL